MHLQALFTAVLLGLLFLNMHTDQVSIRDRFSCLFLVASLYPFMVVLDTIAKYQDERVQVDVLTQTIETQCSFQRSVLL